jgi:hypothetical protein
LEPQIQVSPRATGVIVAAVVAAETLVDEAAGAVVVESGSVDTCAVPKVGAVVLVLVDVEVGVSVVGVVVLGGATVVGEAEASEAPTPPNISRWPAPSYARAAPARAVGVGAPAWGTTLYQVAPFQAHVSSSSWPSAPRPPNRMSWWSRGSKPIEAISRAGGAWIVEPGYSLQVDPSDTHVSLERRPLDNLPPKSTNVPVSLS